MPSFRKFMSLGIFIGLIFSVSLAQKQTGSIVGMIKDNTGSVLPGVNVSVSGPSLIQGRLTATTTAGGAYRFINLPPGFYSLTAELAGFKKIERKDLRIYVGETITLDLVMEQGVIEQSVTVTAPIPAVDVKKSDIAIVLTSEALKGLPLSYNRDLQEDKEPLIDAHQVLFSTLLLLAEMLPATRINEERMRAAAAANYALATDVADFLARKGMPFRQAHQVVGKLVKYAQQRGKELSALTLKEYQRHSPLFDEEVLRLDLEGSLKSRNVPGGTAPEQVRKALREARLRLQQHHGKEPSE